MSRIESINLHDLCMPFREPYPNAIATLTALETLLVIVTTDDGSVGFGEAAIVEGYTHETREGGWDFCNHQSRQAIGIDGTEAIRCWLEHRGQHSHAVAALVSAAEMALSHPILKPPAKTAHIPILAPVNAKSHYLLQAEIDRLLSAGFKTLKVKVGFDVDSDLQRLGWIQAFVSDRAAIRLDGNQGYRIEQALEFVRRMSPQAVELFEQPCKDTDWDAAVNVARVSPVPMMLDESIYESNDIDRAGRLQAAQYIKLKLVKSGGLSSLLDDLYRITQHGMRRVLGNGVASEVGCWMEACIAQSTIDIAGEFNGYLKPTNHLFQRPLGFADGCLVLPSGFWPVLDMPLVQRLSVRHAHIFSGNA
jgi:L-alanine-DL-glutamate epimerase-like enolase superfamily enzyme